jgi:pimeloyl-ACP methyl ester carboxylesterase
MSRTLYALLVGIDDYPAAVPPLNGCLNDIGVVETFLMERAAGEGFGLELLALRNNQASRQAVIDAFLNHLGQASKDDVVLFYYSGHGSQENTPPEFWHLEPDRLDETMVCYDSRLPGNYDLADKELAKLIAQVATNDPHILIILDSCHSGSGTRAPVDVKIRRAPTDTRARPIGSFLVTPDEARNLTKPRAALGSKNGWLTLPRGRHIVMAACQEDEEAKEIITEGGSRGVFSYCLAETLQIVGSGMTYRDVFKRVNALVRAKAARQCPLIEATDVSDLDRPFLGGAILAHTPYFTVSFHKANGWIIDGGAVHGIPAASGLDTTILALFPASGDMRQLEVLQSAIGEARVIQRMPTRSKVSLSLKAERPDPRLTYRAVITLLPLAPLGIQITGEESAAKLIRNLIATAGPGGTASLLVQENADAADLRLLAQRNGYRIMRAVDDRPLVIDVAGVSENSARQTVERLEHIARWVRIANLHNPSTKLLPEAVKLDLYVVVSSGEEWLVDVAKEGAELRFTYEFVDGERKPPRFKMRLTNQSQMRLYCVLLDLPETYGVSSGLLEGNGIWLDPHEEGWAKVNGDVLIPGIVPDEYVKEGLTEIKDILKLIVSTEECDATLLDQGDLDVKLETRQGSSRSSVPMNTLGNLMRRVQTRQLGGSQSEKLADWMTNELSLTIVCPRESVPVPDEGKQVQLAPHISLQGHSGLRALARLNTAMATSRDTDLQRLPPLPPWLVDDPSVVRPFQLSVGRGGEAGLSVLEFHDVDQKSAATVTPDSPLRLRVDFPLQEEEGVLPVGFDGEFFLPLGWARQTENAIEINLERLPEPLVNKRSLTGSIRIFFKKVISEHFGTTYEYPLLAAVQSDKNGKIQYTFERELVRAKVREAHRILLYVHGIIGDTRGMAASAFQSGLPAASQIPLMKERYDLILTFDYENLNTEIEQTARDLKQRLADVGLGEGHDKELHIAAHSMGGLVSRWFIEREAGARVVQHLIMLGTPNGGSPWPVIEDWVTTLLGIGLNSLSAAPWPPSILASLTIALSKMGAAAVKSKKKIEIALNEMNPTSAFLGNLSKSLDPKVRYSIIAGNTSLIPAALDGEKDKGSRLQRLLHKLSSQSLLHETTALAFFGLPNDIAVSVQAIGQVPGPRTPQPIVREVACDHLTYFNTEAGLRELAKVGSRTYTNPHNE